MHPLARAAIGFMAILALAACGGGASTGAPAATGSGESAAASGCTPTTTAGTVTAAMADFAFAPTAIQAKVGDTVTWTNGGPAAHTPTLDNDPTCSTGNIAMGATGSLKFGTAGTFPFHCAIHTSMKGTVTVSP
jgi:plastocyanin